MKLIMSILRLGFFFISILFFSDIMLGNKELANTNMLGVIVFSSIFMAFEMSYITRKVYED